MNDQQPSRNKRASFVGFRGRTPGASFLADVPLLRLGVSLTLLAAGVIHGAQIASHPEESRSAGLFFAVVAALQVGLGVILLVSRSRRLRIAALVVTAGTIAVWIASRTVGIPIGSRAREAIGVADAVATGLELLTAALLIALLLIARRGPSPVVPTRPRRLLKWYVAALTMSLAIASITAVALRPVPPHGHHHVRKDKSVTSGNEKLLDLLEHHGSHEADHGSR